jgi:hypothetical protein
MKFWERFGIGIMSLWGLFAVHQGVNALMKAHNWQRLSPSDWGTWIGSIGTVATLIGTIWLATESERKRRREELDKATLAAARMLVRIPSIQASFSTVRAFLIHSLFGTDPRPDYIAAAKILQDTGTWSATDVDLLVHLRGQTAAKMEMTRSRIELVGRSLVTAASSHRFDSAQAGPFHGSIDTMLNSADEELKEHFEACRKFLGTHGFSSDAL